jgi:hypothetical protein
VKGPRNFSPWVLLSVPLLGVVELVAHLYYRGRTPELQDYAALKPVVEELRAAGDLVVVSPRWAEPNLRWALGDELMPLRDVARPDDSRYPAAVEVTLPGAETSFPSWTAVESRRVDKFEVKRRVNHGHSSVLFDFVDAFGPNRLTVSAGRGDQRKPCEFVSDARVTNGALGGHATFPAERFVCSATEWDFVGVTVIEDQHYLPRRCLWAHPPSGKRTKTLRYEGVRLGQRISGYTGIPFLVDRDGKGAVVELTVKVDGETVGHANHQNGSGWMAFDIATDKYAGGEHLVEFEVFADNSRRRDFCFHADVR